MTTARWAQHPTRRIPRRWTLAIAGAVVVAACSGGSDAEPADDDAAEPASASQSVDSAPPPDTAAVESTIPDDTLPEPDPPIDDPPATTLPLPDIDPPDIDDPDALIWAVPTPDSFSGLDPAQAFDFGTYAMVSQSLEYLTTVGRDGQPRPALAESWTPSEGATVWTFDLRPDVTFHTGETLTADDVVWSIERAISVSSFGINEILANARVDAVDDLTVRFTLSEPSTELPLMVSDAAPQTAIVRDGDMPSEFSLVGTGPFILTDYDEDFGATFVPNADWWFETPTVSRLDFVFYPDPGGGLELLEAGVVHGTDYADPADVRGVASDPDIVVRSFPARNHRQIWMRTDSGTFADVRVREAFALSIDRQSIVDELFGPYARVANDHIVAPDDPGFDASIPQRTKDDEAARALLAEAGFPDGVSVTLAVVDIAEVPDLALLIAAQAESAGFDITLDTQSASTFYTDAWCPGPATLEQPCGDSAEIGIVDYGHRPIDSIFLRNPLTATGPWNASNYTDAAFEELVIRYENAPDRDTASAALIEIQQALRTDVPIAIPYFIDWVFAHRSDVSTVSVTPLGQPRLALAEIG